MFTCRNVVLWSLVEIIVQADVQQYSLEQLWMKLCLKRLKFVVFEYILEKEYESKDQCRKWLTWKNVSSSKQRGYL